MRRQPPELPAAPGGGDAETPCRMVVLVMTATNGMSPADPHQLVSPLRFDERHVEREVTRRLAARHRPELSRRLLALMIDVVLVETGSAAVWHLAQRSSALSLGATLLLAWFAYVTLALTLGGRTIGQHIMGMRVVPDDARAASLTLGHVGRLVLASGLNLATAGVLALLGTAGHGSRKRMWHERFSRTATVRTRI